MRNVFVSFSKNAMLGIIGVVVSSLFVWNTAKAIKAVGTSSSSSSSSSSAVSSLSSSEEASSSSSLSSSSSSSSSSSESSQSSTASSSSLSSSSVSSSSSSSSVHRDDDEDENEDDDDFDLPAWILKWINGDLHKSERARLREANHKIKELKLNHLRNIEKHFEKED